MMVGLLASKPPDCVGEPEGFGVGAPVCSGDGGDDRSGLSDIIAIPPSNAAFSHAQAASVAKPANSASVRGFRAVEA